ncbi:MAG: START domain-containing protein [Pseudomonadota bacterium]
MTSSSAHSSVLSVTQCWAIAAINTALTMVAAPASADEGDWSLQMQEGNVSVYTREVEGSPYHAVLGKVMINAPAARVAEFMGDGSRCAEWRAQCKSSKVLETISDRERYIYMVLDMPWPAKDRDMVVHITGHQDDANRVATITLQSDSEHYPEQKFIRAETRGEFVIKSLGANQVEFIYEMQTDLGGDLSPSLVNPRLTEATFQDLTKLQELAEG